MVNIIDAKIIVLSIYYRISHLEPLQLSEQSGKELLDTWSK